MAPPKEGSAWTFLGVLGEDGETRVPLGTEPGAIHPGTTMKVREVVDAGEIGAYDDSDDCVVMVFDSPEVVKNEETGEPELGFVERAMSFGLATFANDFEEA